MKLTALLFALTSFFSLNSFAGTNCIKGERTTTLEALNFDNATVAPGTLVEIIEIYPEREDGYYFRLIVLEENSDGKYSTLLDGTHFVGHIGVLKCQEKSPNTEKIE